MARPQQTIRLAVAACVLVVAPRTAHAQACEGQSEFAAGPMRVGAGVTVYPSAHGVANATELAGEFGLGRSNGFFGTGTLTQIANPGPLPDQLSATLAAGDPVRIPRWAPLQFCPTASLGRTGVPGRTFYNRADTTSYTFRGSIVTLTAGGAWGASFATTDEVSMVPFLGATYVSAHATTTTTGAVNGVPLRETDHDVTTYGMLEFGVGIVLDEAVTVRPSFLMPFGLGPSGHPTNAFALVASLNFGPRR